MTVTVTLPSGETAEVEHTALALPDGAQLLAPGAQPEGYVSRDYHEAEVRRRSKDTRHIRKDLAEDPEFRRSVLEAAGIPVGDDGKPKIPDVSQALDTARQKWEAETLKPAQESLSKIQGDLSRQALLAAAKGKVRDEFVQPLGSAPSYIETALAGRTRYDADLGYVVALGPDGNPLPSASPKAGRPYATADELVQSVLSDDAYAHLRPADQGQPGAGYRGGSGQGGTQTRGQMSDKAKAEFIGEHGYAEYSKLPE